MDLELRAPVSGPSLTRLGTGDYIDAAEWFLFVNVSHGNYSGDERAPKLLARLARVYPREVDSSFGFRAAAEWGLIQEGVGVVSSGVVGRMWVAPFEWCDNFSENGPDVVGCEWLRSLAAVATALSLVGQTCTAVLTVGRLVLDCDRLVGG
jgi:hypothetical protein